MDGGVVESLQTVLENLPVGLVVHGADSSVLLSNSEAHRLLGLTQEQMNGKKAIDPAWHFVDEEFCKLPVEQYPVVRVLATKGPVVGMNAGICHNKTDPIVWVNVNATPLFLDDGSIDKVIVNFVDITQRKLVEKSLQESEEKLNALFGAMTEMVCLHDLVFDENGDVTDYRIIDCNTAYTKITGIAKEDAVGRLATEVYQVTPAPYLELFSGVGLTGEPKEYTTFYPPMDKHFMISVVSPKKNRFATITTDISSLKQIEEILSAKNRELENYLYVASHDLRSPMVNIQGFSRRLKKQADKVRDIIVNCEVSPDVREQLVKVIDEDIPKTLDFVFTNVSKMDTLINGLLQISRTGRVRMNIQEVDMEALAAKVADSHNYQLGENGGKVEIGKLPPCFGDPDLLNQLLSNLIDNAIKYRDAERDLKISISGKKSFNKVFYEISDTGIGIEERHHQKIWDVFFCVDPTSGVDGEGIGLSIAKRITDKHKGKLSVQSTKGVGSTFYIELNATMFEE